MADYPREGVVILYALLFATQIYLALLWALGKFRSLGIVWNTLTYSLLALTFGLTMLGTFEPPFINLLEQRWLLRAGYTGYLVLCIYAILTHWFSLFRQTMRRDAEDARRIAEQRMILAEDRQRIAEDARGAERQS
jgi:signal transduction histidine kinase